MFFIEVVVFLLAFFFIELCVEKEKFWGATVPFLGFLSFIHWYMRINLVTWFVTFYPVLIWCFLAYIFIGVLWSIYKWFRHVNDYYSSRTHERTIPSYERQNLIVGWITWWPFSMIATIFKDPFVFAYEYMIKVYDKIEDNAKAKYSKK